MAIGGLALGLRLWGLGQLHTLVFDEIYYVPFALDYLDHMPRFDAHPPLGKYLIALGIWLSRGPAVWLNWPTIAVQNQAISPLSFRWLNAALGATVPLVGAWLGWQLSAAYPRQRRVGFGLMVALLLSLEGLTLVESRLGLINLFGLWLGLLGQGCWLRGRRSPLDPRPSWLWTGAAGVCLGAAISVKWNFAGFWLAVVLLGMGRWQPQPGAESRVAQRRGYLVALGLVPLITYGLLWLPHLGLTQTSLLEVHQQLWHYHQSLEGGNAIHPYCSSWYTWPLLLRPVAYFYQGVGPWPPETILHPVVIPGTVYTLHALGNPVLWWLSTAAVLALLLGYGSKVMASWAQGYRSQNHRPQNHWLQGLRAQGMSPPVPSFILVNYAAHWLPWALVSRCTFFYHALGIGVFSTIALAWLLSRWWLDPRYRVWGWVVLGAIALSFWFWLPLYLGLPLSAEALQRRWLIPSWP
ncbi:phospholipid carrier-dependent glycosyltransferase [Nodosilinea sp. P-1105]|uniref:phospholipid carrier-dependent glycosyltransferase n=1 Tax=Nodosilinea sp. P-1105 TaxID=2546229 RepID=UPI00146E06A3|nr:phospholipid carrier-dependent glycosyltransferase [Nodosilinea sp. P-1105]NMF82799.1 phospholipid carrier-dependent glycosyltransferase [Nodosilinea sp. P-1105]